VTVEPLLADPAPLPAPAGLLRLLLVALLALHLVPLSLALGGGLAALLASARGRDPAFRALAARLGRALPALTAAAATTGAGAMAFLVALHGRVALPAAVVMAWPWLSIGAFLAVATAGHAAQALLAERRPAAAARAGAAATLSVAAVAFLFASHAALSAHPERHLALWLAGPRGASLPLVAPWLWPRLLHLLAGALAAGGLWTLWEGARLGGAEGRRLAAAGATGLAAALAAAVPIGAWALLALPPPARGALLGGDVTATAALALAALLTLSALAIAVRARGGERPGHRAAALAGHLVPVLALMAVVRDAVRQALVDGAPAAAPRVRADWPGLAAFAVALAAGLAALAWLWRAWRRAGPPAPSPPGS
jgi:hypothetical protein